MYSSEPFDAILDTIGVQALYNNSPAYLKPDGPFVNVGGMEGIGTTLWSGAKNLLWPQFLGGTPRKYIFQQTNPTQERSKYLVRLVEEGKLKVVIDQVFEMEDALQVSSKNNSHSNLLVWLLSASFIGI
jgi:NADPH:quinone reductase-like Zn-dependent oxidoreductase